MRLKDFIIRSFHYNASFLYKSKNTLPPAFMWLRFSITFKHLNLDTGKKYTSLLAAEEDTGINRNCISAVCLGKMISAGGYHWEYL